MKQKVRALIKFVLIHGGIGVVFFCVLSWLPISAIDWLGKHTDFFVLALLDTVLILPFLHKMNLSKTKFYVLKVWFIWLLGIAVSYILWVCCALIYFIRVMNF